MPWLTAFLDVADDDHARELAFWQAVTGYAASPVRGVHGEFLTLLPPNGDPQLRVQRLGAGPARVHLDVHVDRPPDAAVRATALGASIRAELDDVIVLRSPGGMELCLVGGHEAVPAGPAEWGGHRSIVDQVSLDVPSAAFDAECAFWAALLDLPLRGSTYPIFRSLERPDDVTVRVLFQRRDAGSTVAAHLDLATDDRPAEEQRHRALGAYVVRRTPDWTTLRDPAGLEYCLTDRPLS